MIPRQRDKALFQLTYPGQGSPLSDYIGRFKKFRRPSPRRVQKHLKESYKMKLDALRSTIVLPILNPILIEMERVREEFRVKYRLKRYRRVQVAVEAQPAEPPADCLEINVPNEWKQI